MIVYYVIQHLWDYVCVVYILTWSLIGWICTKKLARLLRNWYARQSCFVRVWRARYALRGVHSSGLWKSWRFCSSSGRNNSSLYTPMTLIFKNTWKLVSAGILLTVSYLDKASNWKCLHQTFTRLKDTEEKIHLGIMRVQS